LCRHAAAAKKALELDDSLAEAHASLGLIATENSRFIARVMRTGARGSIKPRITTHRTPLAVPRAHGAGGNRIVLLQNETRARALDPLSMVINADLSIGYLYARRYDEAEAQARKTLNRSAIFSRALLSRYGAATKGTTQRGDPGISKRRSS